MTDGTNRHDNEGQCVERRQFLTAVSGTVTAGLTAGKAGASSRLPPWLRVQAGERTQVEVISVADGDTVDIRFEDGTEETVRVLGVDTPEKEPYSRFERPEEWEGLAYSPTISKLDRITFSSSCSLRATDSTQLTDERTVALWAEKSAHTESTDDQQPVVSYREDSETPVPVVAVDGSVVGFGSILVNDDRSFEEDQEEFLINVWNQYVGSGTVLWDEGHDQFYTLDKFTKFRKLAARNNYTITPTDDLTAQLESASAVVITSPGSSFTGSELDSLRSFLDSGGAVFLHSQSDFEGFDQTANLNTLARELGVSFRFNDDQIVDEVRNENEKPFRPWTERFNESAFPSFFRDRAGLDGGATSRSTPYLLENAQRATAFAKQRLAGKRVEIAFDPDEPRKDANGRLLAYIYYDATGDGSRETLYNLELITEGRARVYASGFSRFQEFRSAEESARQSATGVWSESDIGGAPAYRNRSVSDLFVPDPVPVYSTAGPLPAERTPVFAPASATQDGSAVSYEEKIPLVGVDPEARTAVIGGSMIDEKYEQSEGFAVDISIYENFVLVANLIAALSERDGPVLIEGGHGQFASEFAVGEEETAYFKRYLEGQQIRLEQINELKEEYLDGRALLITSPPTAYSTEELRTVQSFATDGGAVILIGSAGMTETAATSLNEIATALQTDLRIDTATVTAPDHSRNGNSTLIETEAFNEEFTALLQAHDGNVSLPESATRRDEIETPEKTIPTQNSTDSQGSPNSQRSTPAERVSAGEDGSASQSGRQLSAQTGDRTLTLAGISVGISTAVVGSATALWLWLRNDQ